jgi:hypothetical protein
VFHELESLIAKQMCDIVRRTRNEIIHAQYIKAFLQKSFAQMRTKKTRAACNKNSCHSEKDENEN